MDKKFKEEYLRRIDDCIKNGKYKDTWESLAQYRVPQWYEDIKFGIFIHWGVFSVPAFANEWYPRGMYIQGTREFEHHVATYGPHKQFGYRDFVPMFKAEKFDPDEWTGLFKEAGAQYMIPVAEHHDGFQMYDSEVSEWNAAKKGPKRNVLGELFASAQKKGIVTGCSSHRIEHWFFLGHARDFESDMTGNEPEDDIYWPSMPEADHFDSFSEPTPTKEFLENWLIRCCELADRYMPKIMYFDWWIHHSSAKPYLRKFAAYYYNRAEERGCPAVINYKHDAFQFGTAVVDIERGKFADVKPYVWQTDTTVAHNSWCYTTDNLGNYKNPVDIVRDLVDIVSKNGRLLLNVGPKSDGTIPSDDAHILKEIGKWMKVNGEAIYGSKVWRYSSEGPAVMAEGQFSDGKPTDYTKEDFRFTAANGRIYVFAMKWPEDGEIVVRSLKAGNPGNQPTFSGIVTDVDCLAAPGATRWSREADGLHISVEGIKSDYPVVFKVSVE